jgi:UrcA family protein
MHSISRAALFGTAVFALAASGAVAQDYGRYEPAAYGRSPERVEVIAPRPQRSEIGAPIVDVALSREVRFDDLDLDTRHGVRELRERVRNTARDLCRQIDFRYPIAANGSPPCYRTAVADAMDQVDEAIDRARR